MSNPTNSVPKQKEITGNRCDTKFDVKKCSFLWTIDNYSTFATRAIKLKSSVFSADDDDFKWHLEHSLWRTANCADYVSLQLHPNCYPDLKRYGPVSGNAIISTMKPDYTKIKTEKRFFVISFDKGNRSCNLSSVYLNEMRERSFQDRLTILCELTYVKSNDIVNISTSSNSNSAIKMSECGLSRDFQQILIDEQFTDVTVSVKGKTYRVHKAILAARSSVFSTMFRSNMRENKKNHIVISDMDRGYFEEMLHYIYTGKVKNLEKSAYELLPIADKYDLLELRNMCEEVLFKKISMENAAKILILADMHNADKLKARTLQFIKLNNADCKDFKKTEVWNVLTTTRPQLMKDMLTAFFDK